MKGGYYYSNGKWHAWIRYGGVEVKSGVFKNKEELKAFMDDHSFVSFEPAW